MSENRRRRRQDAALYVRLATKLEECCQAMCNFLDQQPKPSTMAVQLEFIRIRDSWRDFCDKNGCSNWDKDRFNREFGVTWKQRYTMPVEKEQKDLSQGSTSNGKHLN